MFDVMKVGLLCWENAGYDKNRLVIAPRFSEEI